MPRQSIPHPTAGGRLEVYRKLQLSAVEMWREMAWGTHATPTPPAKQSCNAKIIPTVRAHKMRGYIEI